MDAMDEDSANEEVLEEELKMVVENQYKTKFEAEKVVQHKEII